MPEEIEKINVVIVCKKREQNKHLKDMLWDGPPTTILPSDVAGINISEGIMGNIHWHIVDPDDDGQRLKGLIIHSVLYTCPPGVKLQAVLEESELHGLISPDKIQQGQDSNPTLRTIAVVVHPLHQSTFLSLPNQSPFVSSMKWDHEKNTRKAYKNKPFFDVTWLAGTRFVFVSPMEEGEVLDRWNLHGVIKLEKPQRDALRDRLVATRKFKGVRPPPR